MDDPVARLTALERRYDLLLRALAEAQAELERARLTIQMLAHGG